MDTMNRNLTSETAVSLVVAPLDALVDEPLTIRLCGLQPGQSVKLRARARDTGEHAWASSASFVADSKGEVDLATQRPVAGSYQRVDPMGLFWSMQSLDQKPPAIFSTRGPEPIEIEL